MAAREAVFHYLACWFQAGKTVTDGQRHWRPVHVAQAGDYSPEFLALWRQMEQDGLERYSLSGTEVTLAQLCSPEWEFIPCSRCGMPVPVKVVGMQTGPCPCADLPLWPNLELPLPHGVVDEREQLMEIQERLQGG
ncbi:MAG: hypothetical protein RMI89_09550 [Gloeomargarita sp. SKYBB_i_bin120]|nr:hypothetical protein [Gloeomargarita sp. SKYB120]MDW8178761.1 hypothetical protein [Gloeomargarita sp. SKYBB_i_bin120]